MALCAVVHRMLLAVMVWTALYTDGLFTCGNRVVSTVPFHQRASMALPARVYMVALLAAAADRNDCSCSMGSTWR